MQALDDDTKTEVKTFCDKEEINFLVFSSAAEGVWTATSELPDITKLKKKILFVHKCGSGKITKDNLYDRVLFMEATKDLMSMLNNYCHHIYLSTLSNPANQTGWSDLISKDLMDKYHVFLANLHVTCGLMMGKTLLPLPPKEATNERASSTNKDRVHILESAVITWTKQISHVLKQDPEVLLKTGNPGPQVELEFWRNKASNLNVIYLQSEQLKKVLKFLEQNKSTYTQPFSRLQKEVEQARDEAIDNDHFLKTLVPFFDVLTNDGADYEKLPNCFDGLLHTILLVWKYSKYYNTPGRLVVLIREVCNVIINQSLKYINGPQIFTLIQNEEAKEAVDKLERTLAICTEFKDRYAMYKDIAEQQPNGGWKIQSNALFVRLDAFRERCRDILDFTKTIVQFIKLERIDIGGTKGKLLTQAIVNIYDEFQRAVAKFQSVDYDIMDIGEMRFDDDFFAFRMAIRELDRRMATVLGLGFDDLDSVAGRAKLFDGFEGLLERPILEDELEKKYTVMLTTVKGDLKVCKTLFSQNKTQIDLVSDIAPLFLNFPPVAGAIYWVRALKQRIDMPMSKLLVFNKLVREKPEEYREVEKLYNQLSELFDDYETKKYKEWKATQVEPTKEKLKMRLLRRMEKTGLLKVNFDPALVRLLRETRYFLLFGLEVPDTALNIFSRADVYRTWCGQFDIVVGKYNAVLTELLPVEEPLLEDKIVRMDSALSPGLTDLRWKSEEKIPALIKSVTDVVGEVSDIVDAIKGNLKKISAIIEQWCQSPLLERKAKPMAVDEFDLAHKANVGTRLHMMGEAGKEIHKFLKDSNEALKVAKSSNIWKNYVDFVNNIMIEGFVSVIAVSLQYLCEILDPLIISRHDVQPLFDIKIELDPSSGEIVFDPPFAPKEKDGVALRGTINGWLKDFFAMAAVTMPRLDTGTGDYLNEMKEHFQMQCLLSLVFELIDNTEMKCIDYRQTFMQHSFLWKESLEETFADFLLDGAKDLVNPEVEDGMDFHTLMDTAGIDMGPKIPPFERFDEQITRFKRLKEEIAGTKTPVDIHWLRINSQPVKINLVQYVAKWEEKYSMYLHSYVEQRIVQLMGFINNVQKGLTEISPADDPENSKLLYQTMTHIRDVKFLQGPLKTLFEPIRQGCNLLRKHGVPVAEEHLIELEAAPARWEEVIRAAFDERERILPLQNVEMLKIRHTIDSFGSTVGDFRTQFRAECPFDHGRFLDLPIPEELQAEIDEAANSQDAQKLIDAFESEGYDRAYQTLDDYYVKTHEIQKTAKEYNNLEILFDISVSNYRSLKESLDDLGLLKNLWDTISMIKTTFKEWNTTLWDKINTDDLMQRVKEFQMQMKVMPKGMRTWPLYNWLVDQVKNMATVLPLINDLRSDTMRDRHWTMIMAVTGKHFEKGPNFCFRDLLVLNLHHFADDVSEIVDQSAKEAKIDKKLTIIRNTWSKMEMRFNMSNPDVPLLEELGETVEILEAHSLEMVGMTSQGRFIEFCQAVVDEWSAKLRTIDAVVDIWQKVQLNWSRLEPIFMQSDDIRSQLPDESKRFEAVDGKWKELMLDASQSTMLVEICCAEGRLDALREIHDTIETCEKALNDYLEQKKKAFPRFYFVANQALLDILSNGNRPLKVAAYLGDVFDATKTLDFSKSPDDGKIGCGMVAKDGEYVAFHEDFTLTGAVETYLYNLEGHVRLVLRDQMEVARGTAENWEIDNPREFWLEPYCAQIALLITMMVWTEETGRAFEEIEAGSETAMKDYKRVCDDRIEKFIIRVQTDLSPELRVKIITVITIDVHGRDVVEGFVNKKIMDAAAFAWQSQLKFYMGPKPQNPPSLVSLTPDELKTCFVKICDWVTVYLYEYVGNCGRLVITPLTDRCYITLSQALNLTLGGAPAGPAGTGKTETTKDLCRALALPIVVFNCSDQMSYLTTANIFMGLAQVGAWGCFDEFNRISIEVLSVVSTQYKAILDAIRENAKTFLFMDEEIKLIATIGAFITMNPGYAGRTELPENLKALFRSCAMIVPDLTFICENMLMSEGFVIARPLSRKFVTLYGLSAALLSKQMHYDWGLRAVKSLLRQAGKLKRKEPDADENPVLCRALRDFNTPKITTMDMPIFLRLIKDLFTGVWPDPFVDVEFTKVCAGVIKKRGLQTDSSFVVKVVSLLDILFVRHCCFIIGPGGCSKTEVWKSLMAAVKEIGQEGLWEQINPKAITHSELYGSMSKTKEWKDGAIAVVMRNMSKEMNGYKPIHQHRWVILDGDIDAEWIESMNTVMDDNKVLTLVSNERIAFAPTMRMLLEIENMKHASPATVSRGGVLFINETDVGWKPFMESWRENLDQVAQSTFYLLFANYFEANIDSIRKMFAFSCPLLDMGFIQSITCMIDALLNNNSKENMEALKQMSVDDQKLVYEAYFIYAMNWAIGASVADDKVTNYRKAWGSFYKGIAKVKYPEAGNPEDYRFDTVNKEWVHWENFVKPYEPIPGIEVMYQNIVVSGVDIEKYKYVLDLHISRYKPVLYVGVPGTGKTTIVKDYLTEVKIRRDDMMSSTICNNSYTSSYAFQSILVSSLDKRTGRTYGPPSNKKCIFFVDDLNMPAMDKYDTQSGAMLLLQMLSYMQIYDRDDFSIKKDLQDIQFVCCMNPKAGSFMINDRLQRHFTVVTTFLPTAESIKGVYGPIVDTHFKQGFPKNIQDLGPVLVQATVDVLQNILNTPCFLPSAAKFHYQFNLKDAANIFQGIVFTNPAMFKDGPAKMARCWLHEANRVFGDRLVSHSDVAELQAILEKVHGKHIAAIVPKDEMFQEPLIWTTFMAVAGGNDKVYLPIKDLAALRTTLEDQLRQYNEANAAMNLVLFEDAMKHISRICRIIDFPCGHALLVGVGGSGKQSLSYLSCFIMQITVVRILVNQSYGMAELKLDLQEFYKKAAVKPGTPHAFLMTDGQIADERFLVYLNDMLASGNIPDLFTREEYDAHLGAIRNLAKAAGVPDDRDALFQYFLDRVRKNLHMILCHSPVGDDFRIRGRKFPALISCMVVDEFMAWPRDALQGVAARFLEPMIDSGNFPTDEMMTTVCDNMAEVHLSIDVANQRYLAQERRYNYTTPKSFLELISFYMVMLKDRQAKVTVNFERLEKGLTIMEQVQEKVEGLKEDLKVTMVQVEEKKTATDALIAQVTEATDKANIEKAAANEEAEKTNALAADAAAVKAQADGELSEAMPAMEAAKEAVNCLTKPAIQELKSLGKPPVECIDVCAACAFLLKNEKKKLDWKGAQKMMNNPGAFLDEILAFDANNIPDEVLKNVEPVLAQPFFTYDIMKGKSTAAAYLTNWVINIVGYNKIYKKVAPLMEKVRIATETKEKAEASLAIVMARVKEVEEKVASLNETLSNAVSEKEAVEAQAAACLEKLGLAERLVNGLADEYKRWTNTVKDLKELGLLLIGDCLLASEFVGYISPFSSNFRLDLWKNQWIPDIEGRKIPISKGVDPLKVLTNEAEMAGWANEGLPADRVSLENASVIVSCARWPLMIDPQLQGVKWIKQRFGEDLTTIQLSQNNWLNKVVYTISMGLTLLIEAVGSEIDAILEPLLGRAVIKRGRSQFIIKLGGEEVEYDPKFKLFLQSKLANPHYRPEIAAQCTIINFIVTPSGLEDQILAIVVNIEKPELEQKKQELVRKQNEFKVTLSQLEDDLLAQLSAADPATILENMPLIEGLEVTKATSAEINEQVKIAVATEIKINESREMYRPAAAEGSMLFFLIIQLCFVEHMYQYSLDAFRGFLEKAIDKAPQDEDTRVRALHLIDTIRMVVFRWVNRGLFERHKLIFCALLTFQLFQKGALNEDYNATYMDFLLKGPVKPGIENPIAEWLPNTAWFAVNKLVDLEGFDSFAQNMEKDAPNRFREWCNELAPEDVKLPLDWKKLEQVPFQKLLVLRCLRPDRMTIALTEWIVNALPNGKEYVFCDGSSSFFTVLSNSFEDSTNTVPIFFILSQGADPVKEVEAMGRKMIGLQPNVNYHNVAMGQGQDVVAMAKLDMGHKEGHWVMLQNVHLMPSWCKVLEKTLDNMAIEGSHPNFRLFLSADPSNGIPPGILERSIKLTNEPPQGLQANLRRAFALFTKEDFDDRDAKVKAILFGLCHFHAIMLERKKFGPMGYNMMYPFSNGDLRDSASVLYNYLEGSSSAKIPWDDLRYIFGEIMYGGHIVDDYDRRLCATYLAYFMRDDILDELQLVPYCDNKLVWFTPASGSPHEKVVEHLETMPAESPLFYGMHPNAEIGFRTTQCNLMFDTLQNLRPKEAAGDGDGATASPMQIAEQLCNEIFEEIKEIRFAVEDTSKGMSEEEKGPYQFVFLHECQNMNNLIGEMVRGLGELQLGFKGELQMSEQMEALADSLFKEKIAPRWQKLGFPTTRNLANWLSNLKERCEQLNDWIGDPLTIPKVVDIAKFFNPRSFLTAIKQLCCQQQQLELDKLDMFTEVTKREKGQMDAHARDGCYVCGLFLEGARWDINTNSMEESKPKEMFCKMPVIICKAGLALDREEKNVYMCPTYCTPGRRPDFVFLAQLRTKQPGQKWILGGVAMILDIGISM
ncbi:unnamed protein product [Amoebophrya sp. A120]|nr:unnamed protein product [Amoebophrya sp. A120]|eukprot:GSA120T00017347001.1